MACTPRIYFQNCGEIHPFFPICLGVDTWREVVDHVHPQSKPSKWAGHKHLPRGAFESLFLLFILTDSWKHTWWILGAANRSRWANSLSRKVFLFKCAEWISWQAIVHLIWRCQNFAFTSMFLYQQSVELDVFLEPGRAQKELPFMLIDNSSVWTNSNLPRF